MKKLFYIILKDEYELFILFTSLNFIAARSVKFQNNVILIDYTSTVYYYLLILGVI